MIPNIFWCTCCQNITIQSWFVLQTYNTFQHKHDLFYRHTIRYNIIMISSNDLYKILKTTSIFWVSQMYFCFTWANFRNNMINHNYVSTQLFFTSWFRIYFDAPVVKILQYNHDLFYRHKIRFNTNMICSTDTQYVSTQTWSVLQTHNTLQYYHDLFERFVQNIKNHVHFLGVSNLFLFHMSQLQEQHDKS